MSETSRTINHQLNELLSKSKYLRPSESHHEAFTNVSEGSKSKTKLDTSTAIHWALILRANILGKDKQEKVNSIVVLAKLLDCVNGTDAVSDDFSQVLDHTLFQTLYSIVSANMSTETYKAILKISVMVISGAIFVSKEDSIVKYLPLFETLLEFLDVIDIMTEKLYLQDSKIVYNSIKLVSELIAKALLFNYQGIITLAGRLKHVTFFSTVDGLLLDNDETANGGVAANDKSIADVVGNLKSAYYELNEWLNAITFDLALVPHQIMLNNLFIFLEVSLNEFGTPATIEEYVKAGFTDEPRQFVVENLSVLLAMDLKIFLKDPNMTFKKRFHEELMISDHSRTFPIYALIERVTYLWLKVFEDNYSYPNICSRVLCWEVFIYFSMNLSLILWQDTGALVENETDVDKIIDLLEAIVEMIEEKLSTAAAGLGDVVKADLEEILDSISSQTTEELRQYQVTKIKKNRQDLWAPKFVEFGRDLNAESYNFVAEQRLIQLLKGSWVFTEHHGELLANDVKSMLHPPQTSNGTNSKYKYYFVMLAPNRQSIYYKEFVEKSTATPSYEIMEQQSVRVADIAEFKSKTIGNSSLEDEKKPDRLITVKGSISYEKISLVSASGKLLLTFYTDTEVKKYVWLDGLKMLKSMTQEGLLSRDTETQLATLSSIRTNTQLLNLELPILVEHCMAELEDYENGEAPLNEDDDEFYELDELERVTEDFYYG